MALSELAFPGLDLWGARCGVLHTMSPRSDLSSKGKVPQFAYVRDALGGPLTSIRQGTLLVINPWQLFRVFRQGVAAFLADVHARGSATAHVQANWPNVYLHVEKGP